MSTQELLPQRRRHRLERGTYATTAYEYFFTVCARHQGEPFRNASLAAAVIDSLLWTKSHYHWALFCYCLMPDHLHFVCRLMEGQGKLINAGACGIQPEGVLDHLARFKSFYHQSLLETRLPRPALAEEQL
jgi:hypothetical protein